MLEPEKETISLFEKNNLIIKDSVNDDIDGINKVTLNIYRELCPVLFFWKLKHNEEFNEQFYGKDGQDSEKRIFYTIFDKDKIVGSGGIIQENPKIAELSRIYLLQEYRGKGLGKALVKDLIVKAQKLDYEKIYLTTRREFENAIKLYERLGFQRAKCQKFPKAEKAISLELMFH
ncbi:MAG: GNAT family N-acetyltransferase [Candidatus Pacearchaeota archaeon]|nr:GNAT family N-acetyltransferase [Candidatus Pacearchaeota archaeon]